MNEAAVNEALGELLSPSQANTYLACPAVVDKLIEALGFRQIGAGTGGIRRFL
jgi:hypothetical protein